jgi:hypothetical protein
MLPNYLHIGAAKCKSSWLYQVCLRHPDIYVPGENYDNVNFFTTGWHRGLAWYEKTYFAGVAGEKVVGEFSNSYMVFEPALQRIAATVPNAKLTMTVMNPVDRIFYNWAHFYLKKKCRITQSGKTTLISRVELQAMLESLGMQRKPGMIVPLERLVHHHGHAWFRQFAEPGFYAFHIARIHRYFKPEQLHVMLYDDLLEDQARFLRDYFRFLGVAESFRCDLKPEATNPDPPMAGNEIWFPPALRAEFIEVYREDILALQRLLNRDLSHWLDPDSPAAYRLAPR